MTHIPATAIRIGILDCCSVLCLDSASFAGTDLFAFLVRKNVVNVSIILIRVLILFDWASNVVIYKFNGCFFGLSTKWQTLSITRGPHISRITHVIYII